MAFDRAAYIIQYRKEYYGKHKERLCKKAKKQKAKLRETRIPVTTGWRQIKEEIEKLFNNTWTRATHVYWGKARVERRRVWDRQEKKAFYIIPSDIVPSKEDYLGWVICVFNGLILTMRNSSDYFQYGRRYNFMKRDDQINKLNEEQKLTSTNLKIELWRTLIGVRDKKVSPSIANSIARQSQEIIRVVQTELKMSDVSNTPNSCRLLPLE